MGELLIVTQKPLQLGLKPKIVRHENRGHSNGASRTFIELKSQFAQILSSGHQTTKPYVEC